MAPTKWDMLVKDCSSHDVHLVCLPLLFFKNKSLKNFLSSPVDFHSCLLLFAEYTGKGTNLETNQPLLYSCVFHGSPLVGGSEEGTTQ